MNPVFISLSHRADRQSNLRLAFEYAGIDFLRLEKIIQAENGKPYLVLNGLSKVGFSVSHCKETEMIALLDEDREIGIDLEVWPQREADPAFLQTVASVDDRKALVKLQSHGNDAGIALWVLKEAALKCTGEVMTDPLQLSVAHVSRNLFRVKSSASAGAPHPEIDVCLHVLTSETNASIMLLVGLAMPAGALINRPIHFAAEGWKVAKNIGNSS
jgi:phosphopantetheinyl transferase